MTAEEAEKLQNNVNAKRGNKAPVLFNPYVDKQKGEKVHPDAPKSKKRVAHPESELQKACVKWVHIAYPQFSMLFFAVPNGGYRNAREAKIMKAEGVLAGVADLQFCRATKQYHGLFIELKAGKNTQSEHQKAFQSAVEMQGYRYEVVYDFDVFRNLIDQYIADSFAS